MKHLLLKVALWVVSILSLCGCGNQQPEQQEQNASDSIVFIPKKLKYAKLFEVYKSAALTKVVVKSPQDTLKIMATYLLKTSNGEDAMSGAITVPIKNIATLSATHIGMLSALEATDKIIAHGQFDYVYNPELRKRINEGGVTEIGEVQNLGVEKLVSLSPGLLMTSGYQPDHENLTLVKKSGVPVAFNLEWMEASPLARAEWLKFVGLFLGEEAKADSIFNVVEHNYLSIVKEASKLKMRPTVMVGSVYKGTWYMPGGDSYMAKFLKDAGADYYWAGDSTKGSLALSFEAVLENQMNSEFWINPGYVNTREEVLDSDERYAQFKPYKTGEIYNYTARVNKEGVNDYWEQGVVRPDIILHDLVKIFHPDIYPQYSLYFYTKLH